MTPTKTPIAKAPAGIAEKNRLQSDSPLTPSWPTVRFATAFHSARLGCTGGNVVSKGVRRWVQSSTAKRSNFFWGSKPSKRLLAGPCKVPNM